MTGPLAQEFAQVRETLALHNSMALSGEQPSSRSVESLVDSLAALSVIERHVHDMEKALRQFADLGPDTDLYLTDVRDIARAALPAQEGAEA